MAGLNGLFSHTHQVGAGLPESGGRISAIGERVGLHLEDALIAEAGFPEYPIRPSGMLLTMSPISLSLPIYAISAGT